MFIITPPKKLTSYAFYTVILPQFHACLQQPTTDQIIFDFSDVEFIDSLVLPNLLCVGYWIVNRFDKPAKISVPSSAKYSRIRTYLSKSNFLKIARNYGLFIFDDNIEGGLLLSDYKSSINNIFVYEPFLKSDGRTDEEKTKERIYNQLQRTLKVFLADFITVYQDADFDYASLRKKLFSFCYEMIENAILHGNSFCFLGLQYYSTHRIKIAISDCGRGFMNSINDDRSRSIDIRFYEDELELHVNNPDLYSDLSKEKNRIAEQCPQLHDYDIDRLIQYPEMQSEAQGISYGLLTRVKFKTYGLFHVYQSLPKGGIIRVHSNDTRLILGESLKKLFAVYAEDVETGKKNESEIPALFFDQLTANERYQYNILTGPEFCGTHIELEFRMPQRRQ